MASGARIADRPSVQMSVAVTGYWSGSAASGGSGKPSLPHSSRRACTSALIGFHSASQRNAVAGYYQGLKSVRERGMFPDTKRYVANILALKKQFGFGNPDAHGRD